MPDSLTDHFLLLLCPPAHRGGKKTSLLDVSVIDAPANRRVTRMADVIQERGP